MTMKAMRSVEGVVPVLVTPLTAGGDVDEAALERLVEFLIDRGVGGFWVLGTNSEDMNLSFRKRLTVAKRVTATVKSRVPVLLGCSFFALEDSLEFIEATKNLELDAYHFMPYHPLYSLDRLEWHYRAIADKAPKPLWGYSSANWCRAVPPEFYERIKGHPNVAGVKFSSNNTVQCTKAISLEEPGFQILTAVVACFHSNLALGVRGTTTSLACAVPEAIIGQYKAFREGRIKESLEMQRRFNAFQDALPKTLKADNFLPGAAEKYILSLRGICEPHMTSYYRAANEAEQAEIRAALTKYRMLPEADTARVAAE
jgi:4-hydroxy-tetrahydrodipicolinate synthase